MNQLLEKMDIGQLYSYGIDLQIVGPEHFHILNLEQDSFEFQYRIHSKIQKYSK